MRIMTALILTRTEVGHRLRLRVRTNCDGQYMLFDAQFRRGTQGIHCTLWTT